MSHVAYTLALRTVHARNNLPFTYDGWIRARQLTKQVYGTDAKAADKAGSLNGWQAALKRAGAELRGRGITSAATISERAQQYYQKGSSGPAPQTEQSYTRERVRDWVKQNYAGKASMIKLDEGIYEMLRNFNMATARLVLADYIKPAIDQLLRTGIKVHPGGAVVAHKGVFLSANLYVEVLRIVRRGGPASDLNPHSHKYNEKVGKRAPVASHPQRKGHSYGHPPKYNLSEEEKKARAATARAKRKAELSATRVVPASSGAGLFAPSTGFKKRGTKRQRTGAPIALQAEFINPAQSSFGPPVAAPMPNPPADAMQT